MNNTYSVKNSAGKTVSFELPAVPAGFRNGARVINVLKRFLKANVEKIEECRKEIERVKAIFAAPRLEFVEVETWYKSEKSSTCNCEIIMRAGDRHNCSTGTAGGWGYDRASGAVSAALYKNTVKPSFDRAIIENIAKLGNGFPVYAGGFADKKSCALPHVAISGVGMSSFALILNTCGLRGNISCLRNSHHYGKFHN